MKNSVIIKGNRYGISIVLDPEIDFFALLDDLKNRLEQAERFFDSDKQLAVSFEGRTLSNDELEQILTIIENNSKLNIQYVMDGNSDLETTFFDIIQTAKSETPSDEPPIEPVEIAGILEAEQKESPSMHETRSSSGHNGLFYKGTLRSGQTLEAKESLVIIGDVNPGATVIAGGNIVILGTLKGSVVAGSNGNSHAFVMALSMNPIQIQIADVIARNSDNRQLKKQKKEAMIATIVKEQICIESVSKTAIQDINF